MAPRLVGSARGGKRAIIALTALVVVLTACSAAERRPICLAYDALRSAVRTLDSARGPAAAGDAVAVEQLMDEVDRLLRGARARLSDDVRADSAARAMLEAANYLEYMTGQFRATGSLDFSITQFASRELTRAASGAGDRPLNC